MSENIGPDLPYGILPQVGSRWHWEPLSPHASCEVEVTEVMWNGEEFWVMAKPTRPSPSFGGKIDMNSFANELSRWIEATVFVSESEEHA